MTKYLNRTGAKKYRQSKIDGTFSLGYRDVPDILKKYKIGKRAIDYGCGTGRSTRFLKQLGFETVGVDNSKEMIKQALAIDDTTQYFLIKSSHIPVLENSCDLIGAFFVLCTISTKEELLAVLKEVRRCLKDNGIFIAVTASDIFYQHEWLSYKTNYPGNDKLKSSDVAKFYLKDLEVELTNYYWTQDDNDELFKESGLEIVEELLPLGSKDDGIPWINETKIAPYVIYVAKKLS